MAVLDILIDANDIRPYAQVSILIEQEDQLQPYILAAQNNDIKPILGNVFWTDLVQNRTAKKYLTLLDGGTYTKDGETLSYSVLKAAIAEYTYARYVMGKNVQDTPFGMVTKESDYTQSASAKQLAEVAAAHRSAGQNYLMEVMDFLNDNTDTYDKYKQTCGSNPVAKGVIRLTPITKY